MITRIGCRAYVKWVVKIRHKNRVHGARLIIVGNTYLSNNVAANTLTYFGRLPWGWANRNKVRTKAKYPHTKGYLRLIDDLPF